MTMKLLSPPLQAFLATAQEKTVHAAAELLHVTQTAVTQRIKSLEKRLEVSLFVRTRRGMLLTSEGESLLRYCQSFLELEGEAISSITSSGIERSVSISISGPATIMRTRVIPACISVMRAYPRLLMQYIVDDSATILSALRKGECQIAIMDPSHLTDEMHHQKLPPENYVLVGSATWHQRDLADIIATEKIIDFHLHDQMTFNYLKKFRLYDMANKERHFTNRTEQLADLIAEGMGYGILPDEFAQPYINNQQLILLNGTKTLSHPLVAAWFHRDPEPAYFSALTNAIANNHACRARKVIS
jgi:DNA-binding transcriptional LysR family regulator